MKFRTDWKRAFVTTLNAIAVLLAADVNNDGKITCGSTYADVNDMDILATGIGHGRPSQP